MKQTKIISIILHYICYSIAAIYLVSFVFSTFSLLTEYGIEPYKDNQRLHLNYPFTNEALFNIENNLPYIIFSFLLPLLVYGIFFLLAARLFKVFFQPKLFTLKNVSELKRFYLFNIFVPLPIVIFSSFFVVIESFIWALVFIHFILGIFSLFFANIFKRGLQLQDEQDLYI
ncbi:DUF2975 domain-containing protein [Polaribacter sp. Hel1_85]|uniref:DUF2975 domain-containing protein n=1 Tax=Polaribacter sp. Hel1_85 TaxID=1250005 RepID=UPI00052B9DCD|nr:DUF2975 domain-containing protein [Polaribacter sp. Hel1_85]KGL62763.1 conserved hypothetical membrane protein [Polaribacter sp. Hel1_85]